MVSRKGKLLGRPASAFLYSCHAAEGRSRCLECATCCGVACKSVEVTALREEIAQLQARIATKDKQMEDLKSMVQMSCSLARLHIVFQMASPLILRNTNRSSNCGSRLKVNHNTSSSARSSRTRRIMGNVNVQQHHGPLWANAYADSFISFIHSCLLYTSPSPRD